MILQSDWSLPHNRDKLYFNLYVGLFRRWAAHAVWARDKLAVLGESMKATQTVHPQQ